ncbi:MAG TPA: hypothetical protein VGB77_07450 [Abditibacteriaceae bacterium]|jgi:hypothetical protein
MKVLPAFLSQRTKLVFSSLAVYNAAWPLVASAESLAAPAPFAATRPNADGSPHFGAPLSPTVTIDY